MLMSADPYSKMRSSERILVLEPIEGQNVKTDKGLIDNRLFTGENNQVIVEMDGETLFWSFRYKSGILPEPLKQKFTTFKLAYEFAKNYFERRGLRIVEVKD